MEAFNLSKPCGTKNKSTCGLQRNTTFPPRKYLGLHFNDNFSMYSEFPMEEITRFFGEQLYERVTRVSEW
jgi:hypothetical protein